ncbi:MAG: CBS domain-containing protein [Nitrospira sp.]
MLPMVTVAPRPRSGLVGESTGDEAYGVLPGEDRLVRDIMVRKVIVTQSSMALKEAYETLRRQKVSALVVYQGNEPVQALAEPDLFSDKIHLEGVPEMRTLRELIEDRVAVRCREDAILADALGAMIRYRTNYVPVLDAKGGLVGALSLIDAIGAVSPIAAERWLAQIKSWSATPPPSRYQV